MASSFRISALLLLLTFGAEFPGGAEVKLPDPATEAWTVLQAGLEELRPNHRTEAVKALSLMSDDPRSARYALRALRDEHKNVRAAAAGTLGQLRARGAVPALRQALSDTEISVVLAAAQALWLLKDKSAYGVYYSILMGDKKSGEGLLQGQLDRLKDPKQMAELGVQEGLGFLPFGGMGYEAIRQLHGHDESPVRAAAARFLALDPDSISEDALVQSALADKSELVRLASLDALAQRGDPKCIERLEKNLWEDKSAVRYRTAAVILHLTKIGARKSRGQPSR
ncbi:MAG TPA: HEAT repeat domain-containing protein [Terriglobales bacterium]|nr:HEAT repeat domain-containing protein [Terriglobales bacterium]